MSTSFRKSALVNAQLAQALLRPSKIALVGVSDDVTKTAARPLQFLRNSGYSGTVYSINPGRDSVQGERSYKSLSELPEIPDHVFILTGSDLAVATVEECGRLGIGLATILAGGFSEAGEAGRLREEKLVSVARQAGVRLLALVFVFMEFTGIAMQRVSLGALIIDRKSVV